MQDIADYSDEEITEEFYSRTQHNNLVHEALDALKQRRYVDAETALERFAYPKFYSRADCQTRYDKAMLETDAERWRALGKTA